MDLGRVVGNYFLSHPSLDRSDENSRKVTDLVTDIREFFPRTQWISSTNFNRLIDLALPFFSSLSPTGDKADKEERKNALVKALYVTPSSTLLADLLNYTERDQQKFNINVSFIPEFRGQIYRQVNRILTDSLTGINLVPGIETRLKQRIQERFLKSLMPPGEAAGVITAQSAVAPRSQQALNSNHNISSNKMGDGGIQLDETFDLKKDRKLPITFLHFQNKLLTWDEVYQRKYQYVNVMLKDLVNANEIKNVSYDSLVISSGPKWWFPYPSLAAFEKSEKQSFLPAITYLSLYPNKVFLAHLTMQEIATGIENYINVPDKYVKCISSPISEGVVYIFTYTDSIKHYSPPTTDEEVAEKVWLEPQAFNEIAIISRLDNISLKGIPEIKSLYPTTINLKNYFMDEVVDSVVKVGNRIEKTSRLYYSPTALRADCVPVSRLVYLLRVTGFSLIPESGIRDYFTLTYTTSDPKKGAINLLTQAIADADKAVRDYQTYLEQQSLVKEEQREGLVEPVKHDAKPKPTEEQERVYKYSRYVYAQLVGANLAKFAQYPEVDMRYTYTNVFADVLKFWDIEALRNYLYREIYRLFVNMETPISYSLAMRIASHMTSLGFGIPLTHVGVKHRPGGPLAKASMDRPMQYIAPGAASGAYDRTTEVSAAVLFGTPFYSGTGLVQISIPPALAGNNEFAEYVFPPNGFGREEARKPFEGTNFTYTGQSEITEKIEFTPIRGTGEVPLARDYAFLPTPVSGDHPIPDILMAAGIEL